MGELKNKKIDYKRRTLTLVSIFIISLFTALSYTLINISEFNSKYIVIASSCDELEYGAYVGSDGTIKICAPNSKGNLKDSVNSALEKIRFFIIGLTALGTTAMVLFFVINLLKLGSTFDNEQARSKVLTALIFSAVAAALLGSATVFAGFFLDIFK